MLDKLNIFEPSARAITSATTYVGTDKWDTQGTAIGGAIRNLGAGAPLYAVITVGAALTGGTAVDFRLVSDADSSVGSPTTHASTGAIADASLTAGAQFILAFPNAHTYERYVTVNAVSTGTHGAGDYTAFVTNNPAQYRAYADNAVR